MQIEYRVRPVTRFIVTRFESDTGPDGRDSGGCSTKGEFDNFDTAYQVAYALCRDEHQRLGWPVGDERIKYPEHHDGLREPKMEVVGSLLSDTGGSAREKLGLGPEQGYVDLANRQLAGQAK
ncbi:hypothetical protein [Ensifer aridi]|uniref:hypothetical protein n=1 Tax=Ensifer aridi TaxID=1708715 RepID=UPI00111BECDE|nr:hypothetical protein [Ensifer aridi]